MPQSLAQVWLHFTFSTKGRHAELQNPNFRDEMFRMLSYLTEQTGCFPQRAGGWIDHVHLVFGLSRTLSIAQLVEHVKTETSKWAKKADLGSRTFSWQAGYAVFSVSQSNLQRVMDYVDRQEDHHQKKSFQDEVRELCRKHGLQVDERYAWD